MEKYTNIFSLFITVQITYVSIIFLNDSFLFQQIVRKLLFIPIIFYEQKEQNIFVQSINIENILYYFIYKWCNLKHRAIFWFTT